MLVLFLAMLAPTSVTLDVPIYLVAELKPSVLAEALEETERIFEPGDIHETATYNDPHQVAQGMYAVVVNGIVVMENGKFTSAAPGRVLSKN